MEMPLALLVNRRNVDSRSPKVEIAREPVNNLEFQSGTQDLHLDECHALLVVNRPNTPGRTLSNPDRE
jgi:hypothetical protein